MPFHRYEDFVPTGSIEIKPEPTKWPKLKYKDNCYCGRCENCLNELEKNLANYPLEGVDEKQLHDACMFFRHDFGLLDRAGQLKVKIAAKEWLHAWRNALREE